MLIARINLDLGVSKGELEKEAKKLERKGIKPGKGTAHRHFVRDAYRSDRAKYVERICRLVSQAAVAGAAIVQLPAAALLVNGRGVTLQEYASNFPAKSIVVAGLLNVARLGYKGDNREGSVVLKNGKALSSFLTNHNVMSACAGHLGKIPAIVAVSSTIRDVRTDRSEWFKNTSADHRLLVLDLGHEQYTGRYKKTLMSVYAHLRDRWAMKPAVILTQWRYAKSSARDNWLVGGRGMSCRRLDQTKNALVRFKDEIDLIELRGW